MPLLPQIDDATKRNILPSATFQPRMANGADFGSQIGDAVQQVGAATQDLSQAVEQAELLKLRDQKQLRDFQLQTDFVDFVTAEQQALAEAEQGIESGAWEFQKNFVSGFDERAAAWMEERGLTEEERAEWTVRQRDLRRGFSTSALQTELAERNRFYLERTTSSLDALMVKLDQNPDGFEAVLDEGQRIINATGLPEAVKDTLSLRLQESAATAYGTALVDRDASAAMAALGGPVTEAGDYTGPTGAAKADFDFFRSQGLPSVAAAAVVGVLSWESGGGLAGINPNGRNRGDGRDGSDSIGAGQWNGPRARALHAFAAERGKPWNDKGVQLEFFMHELKTSEPEAYRRLMSAQTIEQAVEAMSYYERPAGWTRGGDPTKVIHWNERVERAKHFAGDIATETRPPGDPLDPRLANLPYAARRSLLGAAERGIQAEIQRTAQLQQAEHSERLNSLIVNLMDGKAGEADIATAREQGWLTDANEIARANNIVEERNRQNAAENTFNALWASPDFRWNPYDADQKKAIEAGFAANPTMENLQAIVDRTGMMPPNAASAIRGQLLSRDPNVVRQAATMASNAMARNPNVFTAMEGSEDIERAGTMFDYYVNGLGLGAEEAGRRIAEENDPQRPGRVRPDAEALRTFARDTRDRASAARIVARIPGGRGRPIARVQELALLEDYNAIANENFRRYGDEGAARHAAQQEINRLYGITANGTFTKYPPENIYPPVNGSHDYIYEQGAARVKLNVGRDVRPEDIFLMPLPTVTAEAWRRGEPPSYALGYVYEQDGQKVYDVLPGGFRFNVPSGAREADTETNRQRFEGRRRSREEFIERVRSAERLS